jgi:hypothetical protein
MASIFSETDFILSLQIYDIYEGFVRRIVSENYGLRREFSKCPFEMSTIFLQKYGRLRLIFPNN